MKKVRFAICGAGHRGSNLVTHVLCVLDAVEIIAVCDLSREKAEALALKQDSVEISRECLLTFVATGEMFFKGVTMRAYFLTRFSTERTLIRRF